MRGRQWGWSGIALALACAFMPAARAAQWEAGDLGEVALNGQATLVGQAKERLRSPYASPVSLEPEYERSYSLSATAFMGWRPARDTELFFNPEMVQGLPLSHLTGLGGLTNGEMQKVGGTSPTFYRARLFARQTFGLGGGEEQVEADANQFARTVDRHRVVITLGNFAVNDVFDDNGVAHDPRTQFLNWSFLTYGAWDFPADARGYTGGAAAELVWDDWTLRAGRFRLPKEANGLRLQNNLGADVGDALELERRHEVGGRPGALRLLAFRNRTSMGSFQDALDAWAAAGGAASGTVPEVTAVRRRQDKRGLGLTVEQELADDVSGLVRAARSDGGSEVFAFAEIDASLAAALRVGGSYWGRGEDEIGLGLAQNGLSSAHVAYLRAGGLGYFVGDGAIDYAPERIAEAYYSLGLPGGLSLTFDYQRIVNPAYNRARGPVDVAALRLHAQW
ncbi:carbohydrate porin [Derxia gummosa]|uniref:Carbohydrate porin n=1 Tax=Derxia gummosa DSM 723 TaxID=1121388 RepID=A0A8B6XCP7_9BURK|nr:carbohydrate porin [Derxia gummosa]